MWLGEARKTRSIAGETRTVPVLRRAGGSGGSRAANPYGAPRKHGALHSRGRRNRKAPASPSPDIPEPRKHLRLSGEHGSRLVAVIVHLVDQRLCAVELQFLADEADEGDVEHLAVKIVLEIEQEDFKQRRAIVEGRASSETCYAVDARISPLAADPHSVDAMPQPAIVVEADIGRGIAELAAALLAMDHLSGDEPGRTEHGGCLRDLAFGKRGADRAGGHRPFVDIDMGLHIDLDAEPGCFGNQKARRADPTLAEMKVVADRDA